MIRNYFKVFVFLFFLNSVSQNIERVEVDLEQKISDFIADFEISPNDFFILNPSYTKSRFSYSNLDLNQKLFKGDIIQVFDVSEMNELEKINFISHKIKRKQSLSEISSIYQVNESLILKYNDGIGIKKNNILKNFNLYKKKYFLITLHRPETVDDPKKFHKLISDFEKIGKKFNTKFLFPVHPRT